MAGVIANSSLHPQPIIRTIEKRDPFDLKHRGANMGLDFLAQRSH